MGVKAAGGVRTYADAESMIKAGATRVGASAGVKIIQGPAAELAPAAAAAAKNY
jgi:deoxyribose-phosphate aldolase